MFLCFALFTLITCVGQRRTKPHIPAELGPSETCMTCNPLIMQACENTNPSLFLTPHSTPSASCRTQTCELGRHDWRPKPTIFSLDKQELGGQCIVLVHGHRHLWWIFLSSRQSATCVKRQTQGRTMCVCVSHAVFVDRKNNTEKWGTCLYR